MKICNVQFRTLVLVLLFLLNSWQLDAKIKSCEKNHPVFHNADIDNLCQKCALAQGNGINNSSLSCEHLDKLLMAWDSFVTKHLHLEEPYSIDSPLTNYMDYIIGKLIERSTEIREKYKNKIFTIAVVGPFSTEQSTNQYRIEHDIYQQLESLTVARLTAPNMPILKVPSLQETFFTLRPDLNYHSYMYSHVPEKRLLFQTLTTMLRLLIERYVLNVAAVILDHTELDRVIILNSENLCDEDILDIHVDYDIKNATKYVVNHETTPHSLLSFYRRIIRRINIKKITDRFTHKKFSDWYQGAIYMKNQGDTTGWTTKYHQSLKTFFFPFNMIEVELAHGLDLNQTDSSTSASNEVIGRIDVAEKIENVANVDIAWALKLLERDSKPARRFRRKSVMLARPNIQATPQGTGLVGLFVKLPKSSEMAEFKAQESVADDASKLRNEGLTPWPIDNVKQHQNENQNDTLVNQWTVPDWGDMEIKYNSRLVVSGGKNRNITTNTNNFGETATDGNVTNDF